MSSVGIHAPKTPVTKGSNSMATATLPNVCKMPPPPPPFAPTPLPNIGQSGKQPKGYSTSVLVEGQPVAIRGASFGSSGDIASKATGGGIVSNNAEGPTKFIAPGSLSVHIEGKSVHLLGDQTLNNCGPSGAPANSATLAGTMHTPMLAAAVEKNPANEDFCGAGNHDESVQFPEVPRSEWHPSKRIEVMRELARSPEELFEVAAAEHNVASGSITHGRQISRPITPSEKRAGHHEDNQKVMAVCKRCSYRREIDHAPDKNSTVEVKSSIGALRTSPQKTNNLARVKGGKSVTYKLPPMSGPKLKELLAQGFQYVSISV